MRERHTTRWPIGRLLVAALIAILAGISVHGAGCAEVPSGAIATAHASIGAALLHAQPSAGRGEDSTGSGRTAAEERAVEELPPSQVLRPPALHRPAEPWPARSASHPAVTGERAALRPSRAVPGNPSRAPPA